MYRRLIGASAVALLALSACSEADLPPADEAVPDSAAAMAEVETVRFDLHVEGDVEGLSIESAEGVVTADGEAEGTGMLAMFGTNIEVSYVIIGADAYVKGPTGGFQELPIGDDMLPYDPTVILSDDSGVAALLETYDSAEPEDAETIDGTSTYRYAVTFDPEAFSAFIPLSGDWNEATLWIEEDSMRVARAEFSDGDATVTLNLSDYDEPVSIEVP